VTRPVAPTVSVVITTYNQAGYIAATIASVLAQTYRDLELVLVDDGSTDGTEVALRPYRGHLNYIRQANQGVAAARNTGIRNARGRMLAFLDGDDLWEPEKLRRQMEAAEAHASSGLIVADGIEFGPDGVIRESLLNPSIVPLFRDGETLTLRCYQDLIRQNLITTTSQVMVSKSVIDQVGLSDERFAVSSDWDLYLRIAARFEVTFLKARLVRYRYLPTSASGPRALRSFRWGLDEIRVLRKHMRLAAPESRAVVKNELARRTRSIAEEAYYYTMGTDRSWARRYLFNVVRGNPTSLSAAAYLVAACTPRALTSRVGRLLRRVVGLDGTP
jgi:glycosyltransferase involved in cell wall biosynthesis